MTVPSATGRHTTAGDDVAVHPHAGIDDGGGIDPDTRASTNEEVEPK